MVLTMTLISLLGLGASLEGRGDLVLADGSSAQQVHVGAVDNNILGARWDWRLN